MVKVKNENFKKSTKFWICNKEYMYNDIKVRNHSYINGKYRGSAQRLSYQSEIKLQNFCRVLHLIMHLIMIPI